jgi:putative PEP-CTERM system histidine kinase
MITLAAESFFRGLSLESLLVEEVVRWQRAGFFTASFLPGIWLVFTLSYGREESYKDILKRQKWVILSFFAIPVILSTFFAKSFFEIKPILTESFAWPLQLGWSGYAYFIVFLLGGVLILMNLEKTFRASTGVIRWQIKFMLLGLGSLFAVRIYTSSQALLYSALDPFFSGFNAGGLLIADILVLISIFRARQSNVNIYISRTLLYNSFIILIVGIYLIAVGMLVKVIQYFNVSHRIFFESLVIFLTLLGLTIFILSEEVRQRLRLFMSRHFKLPQYDYRREWREFTQRTISLTDAHHLCSAIVKMLAETFGVSSVSIWLFDESKGSFELGGSTVLSRGQTERMTLPNGFTIETISEIRHQPIPIDFGQSGMSWIGDLKKSHPEFFEEDRIVYGFPMAINENFLGLLTLNRRITGNSFSVEDVELLKTLADQAAGNLLNLKLYEHLQQAREMEAYQTMAAFIMHDLKNLASSLSLTVQNLPTHFENPEFRKDALQAMEQGVSKINGMCSHISMLSQKIKLKCVETDFNKLIADSISGINGSIRGAMIQDLQPVPKLVIDPDQFQKVLTNLILNANESVGNGGEVRVTTGHRDGWVTLSVSDNGCGMSKEFMEQSLFRPFKTTKKNGMGIGLFQSKMIVEAHQGRIEVESEEGRGTTFRVYLPLKG